LSDDSRQLFLLRAELSAHGSEKDALPLEAPSLLAARYQLVMAGRFKSRWPVAVPTNRFELVKPARLLELISGFAAREPVVYLHPSAGLFFEAFTEQPKGFIHHLVARAAGDSAGPRLTAGVVATNELIWQRRWTDHLKTLAEQTRSKPQPDRDGARPRFSRLRLATEQNSTASALGAMYSKPLNYWGVEMQRLGRWPEAGVWFQRALELDPGNLSARINAEYNTRCQQGDRRRLNLAAVQNQFRELFDKYSDWREALSVGGPVDEPTFLFRSARMLLGGGSVRQAAVEFSRCVELAPEWLMPKLWFAQCHVELQDLDEALKLTDAIEPLIQPDNGPALSRLLYCRVTAMRRLGHGDDAATWMERFIGQHREQGDVLSVAAELYSQSAQFEQGLALLNELLARESNRPDLLAKKGLAELQLARYDDAIATLTRAIAVAPSDDDVRLNRAIACLGADRLDAARADYLELLTRPDVAQNALFGLGTIAWRQHDTNTAILYYQQYVSESAPNSPQGAIATERLKQLKGARAP
jgi:tetratricopeptide (TPR) repeat protein